MGIGTTPTPACDPRRRSDRRAATRTCSSLFWNDPRGPQGWSSCTSPGRRACSWRVDGYGTRSRRNRRPKTAMTPLEPIPETLEAANELDPAGEGDLLDRLRRLANRAQEIVPDLVGISIARREENITFTLV